MLAPYGETVVNRNDGGVNVKNSIIESLRSDLSTLRDVDAISKAAVCEFDALCPLPAQPSDVGLAEKNGPESGAVHRD